MLKTCVASFVDPGGVKHSVDVPATTLFEAAATAVAIFKRDGWTEAFGPGTRLAIEVHEPIVRHEVTVRQLEEWLNGLTNSPSDRLRKERLRVLLNG